MANSANQADQARFSYYTYDFNVTQNLLREDGYADNAVIATAQKIIKLVGVVVAGGIEAIKNGAKFIANGFIFFANVVNNFFNPAPLKNRQIEVLQPVAPSSISTSLKKPDAAPVSESSSSSKPAAPAPLVIDETDIPFITETFPEVPPSPTDLEGIPFADLIPDNAPSAAELVATQAEVPAQPVVEQAVQQEAAPVQQIVEQPAVAAVQQPIQELTTPAAEAPAQPAVEQAAPVIQQSVAQQEAAPVQPIVEQPAVAAIQELTTPAAEASAQPAVEQAVPVIQQEAAPVQQMNAVESAEPSAPASPKADLLANPSSVSDIDESEEEQEIAEAQDNETFETKPDDSSLEIEVPQQIADLILKQPQAPTYRALDPRRAWQWFFKKSA